MLMDWEKQALYFAAINAVNAFEYGRGVETVEQLQHVVQSLANQLGGTRDVSTLQPGAAALYITAFYLKKVTEP